jgi:hypothetical protein
MYVTLHMAGDAQKSTPGASLPYLPGTVPLPQQLEPP